jgi:hypothetical protein
MRSVYFYLNNLDTRCARSSMVCPSQRRPHECHHASVAIALPGYLDSQTPSRAICISRADSMARGGHAAYWLFLLALIFVQLDQLVATVHQGNPAVAKLTLPSGGAKAPRLGKLGHGRSLEGSVFSTYTTISLVQCGIECGLRTKCLSVNYSPRKALCELNGQSSSTSPDKLVYRTGFLQSDKESWGLVSEFQHIS